jgi:protein arginine kinase activator
MKGISAVVCNLCGTQDATIHLTEIVNNQMIEIHLCETCAQEKGTDFKTHFQLGDIMSNMLGMEKPVKGSSEKRLAGKCPECGMTYEEFGKSGRLGCAFCYEAFGKLLTPLIKRVQRSLQHIGKRPQGAAAAQSPASNPNSDLKLLQDRLKKSIQSEDFEDAAKIRDEIRQMEEKYKKPKKGKSE